MKSTGSTARAAVFGLWVLLSVSTAHAQQQFLLLDTSYTATSQNTSDSHFEATPASGIPGNWKSPTDYTKGKAYVELDILQKPSDQSTLYNICFENDSGAACLPYGPAYTATGHTAWSANFSDFWNFSVVDWTKGVTKVQLILKDMMENKKQGDAAFYPYQAHVVISIVPAGGTYMKPASSGGAAGAAGAAPTAGSGGGGGRMSGGAGRRAAAGSGGMRAGSAGGAGAAGKVSGSAGMSSASAGAAADAGVRDAGSDEAAGTPKAGAGATSPAANGGSGGKPAAGATAGTASNMLGEGGHTSAAAQLEDSSGCTIARVRGRSALSGAMLWFGIAGFVVVRRSRARRR